MSIHYITAIQLSKFMMEFLGCVNFVIFKFEELVTRNVDGTALFANLIFVNNVLTRRMRSYNRDKCLVSILSRLIK